MTVAVARTRSAARKSVETNDLAPFVEARERQHFLDHRGEMRCHRAHALEHVELRLRQRSDDLVREQLAISGERGEGRAQLVRHRGEEPAFRAIGILRALEQLGLPQR